MRETSDKLSGVHGFASMARRFSETAPPGPRFISRSQHAARCVCCGRWVAIEEIAAGVDGFPSLCYCRRCDQKRAQPELEPLEVRK